MRHQTIPFTLKIDDTLVLRQITEGDAGQLAALINRNRSYLRQWLPWVDQNRTIHDTARFIGRSMAQQADNNGLTLGMVYEGELVGLIGQHYLDNANRRTEIGFWIDSQRQGRGIVTRSAACLTNYAFTDQGCNRVFIHCAAGNLKSSAVAERLNFVQQGILREAQWLYDHYVDLIIYSMLKRDWSPVAHSR